MRDHPGPSWWAFMASLLLVCGLFAVLIYRSEQSHLQQIRDACLNEATAEYQKDACIREYEENSAWY